MAPPPSTKTYPQRPPADVINLIPGPRASAPVPAPAFIGEEDADRSTSRRQATIAPPPGPVGVESTPATPSGFAAQIDGASIADLVQLECLRGLTRAVRVTADDGLGFLYFDHGQLVHAVCGKLTGEEAALVILSWQSGTVRPSDSYFSKPPTIDTPWQGLLMAAAQQQDDVARLSQSTHLSQSTIIVDRHGEEGFDLMVEENVVSDEVLRCIRMDEEGHILSSTGEPGEFADTTAYCLRLARLIGEGFGLDDFVGLECTSKDRTLIAYTDAGSVVAVEALPDSDISTHRTKAGT